MARGAGSAKLLERSGKKGNGGNGKLLGAADGSRRLRSLSEVYPGACKKKRQQDLRYFQDKRETDHFVARRNRWLEHEGKRVALQERWPSEWQGVTYEGTVTKAPPCSERRMRTPLLQQSSSSPREEESQWNSVEVQRKWCVAFEDDAAKRKEC